MKMSSMKRHQIFGWCVARLSASVSNLTRNRFAYDGVCLNVVFVLEFENVHSKNHSDKVTESLCAYGGRGAVASIEVVAASVVWNVRVLSDELSSVTSMAFLGNCPSWLNLLRKWLVSLVCLCFVSQ